MLLDTFATEHDAKPTRSDVVGDQMMVLTSPPIRVESGHSSASRLCMSCHTRLGDTVGIMFAIQYPPAAEGAPALPSAIAVWIHYHCPKPDPTDLATRALAAWQRERLYVTTKTVAAVLEDSAEHGKPVKIGHRVYRIEEVF